MREEHTLRTALEICMLTVSWLSLFKSLWHCYHHFLHYIFISCYAYVWPGNQCTYIWTYAWVWCLWFLFSLLFLVWLTEAFLVNYNVYFHLCTSFTWKRFKKRKKKKKETKEKKRKENKIKTQGSCSSLKPVVSIEISLLLFRKEKGKKIKKWFCW